MSLEGIVSTVVSEPGGMVIMMLGVVLLGGGLWFLYALYAKTWDSLVRIWTSRQLRKAIENSDSRQIQKFLKKLEKGDVKINL